jgi:hypothetical protein
MPSAPGKVKAGMISPGFINGWFVFDMGSSHTENGLEIFLY